ncbi:hypothetical protein PHYBLDRAFT_169718 [Phycomyces blakesleeanus NRRL 1555(-)]|uniref:Uncharacterized protein n=1 Tax=Phycomyces blakesleeanus (strain ATCC 8743b / DSM 1359 / FGSC 10004 / NBRC 33097 / NRRL 1555) TaxID=763407 RepID=A0A167ME68_PHYB8|nr:hypothetical protein PHYBLDRAFT_169718 [Phycomyces blakesleeanus NRRL 1555(-)]OAD72594.1 hypothetical protein PHYBLDRAFT_169718 [Phycomyces blakesleeanus NRRL 1555(-)]|eukprot:XP_018290634.1 hypothetical protein PHYBLDRAFT_169718 [Phycomyces blakesleeanus NRRL 1555(-)]
MLQQVVNNPWYNVIGTKALPPTTMPLKLQNLNTMKLSTYLLVNKIGRIKSVNVWFYKKICDMPFRQNEVVSWVRSEFVGEWVYGEKCRVHRPNASSAFVFRVDYAQHPG